MPLYCNTIERLAGWILLATTNPSTGQAASAVADEKAAEAKRVISENILKRLDEVFD